MPRIHIIAVGRLRAPYWKAATEAYAKRLKHRYELIETLVKDSGATLPAADRTALEGDRIIQAMKGALPPACLPVCLDEHGETLTSALFARFLQRNFDAGKTPCFIIGGAYGVSQPVKERAAMLLSLGPMTFPHELARVLLLEQLYRADSITRGRPYHHE